jgi:hypothetical protein
MPKAPRRAAPLRLVGAALLGLAEAEWLTALLRLAARLLRRRRPP